MKRLSVPAAIAGAFVLGAAFFAGHGPVRAAGAMPLDDNSISALTSLDHAMEAVASKVTPAVVNVAVTSRGPSEGLLTVDDFARVEERAAPWRKNVIHPLRAVRRWLKEQQLLEKAPSDQLRRGVLGYGDLPSRGVQQRLMEAAVAIPEGAPSAATAAGNLGAYLAWARVKPGDADEADLVSLLSQVFAPLSRDAAKALLQKTLTP